MKILQISTCDIRGGAARAAYRLHRGLRQMGHDCRMAVRHKDTTDDSVYRFVPKVGSEMDDRGFFMEVVIQGQYINSHRTDISNTLFSLPYPGYDLSSLSVAREADVINLHWVSQFQSPVTLQRLFSLGKPVVWTLHDQWPFTGGCHYAAGCERYKADCKGCPQLSDDPFGLPEAVLKDKKSLFRDSGLTIVTPSRWMGNCARESSLFGDLRIDVIPNSLEIDVFTPIPKGEAKEHLGVSSSAFTLLFGAEYGTERRKGLLELKAAVAACLKDRRFMDLVRYEKIKMICFGNPGDDLSSMGIPVMSLGYLKSDEDVRLAYSAADIFVQASLEDNLPNTLLEAMSCGTPVVAFDVGGMPDLVENGATGQLVPFGDTLQMGDAIRSLLLNPDRRETMGKECRRRMEEGYALSVQAHGYLKLYQELVADRGPQRESLPSEGDSDLSFAPLEPGVGPHFNALYADIVATASKEYARFAHEKWQAAEADRDARLEVIRSQSERISELELEVDRWLGETRRLQEAHRLVEAERNELKCYTDHLRRQIETIEAERNELRNYRENLRQQIESIEADRAARLEVIESQGARIAELESEIGHRFWGKKTVQTFAKMEAERNELRAHKDHLLSQIESIEADRAARLEVIESQGARIAELESEVHRWLSETKRLQRKCRQADAGRMMSKLCGHGDPIGTRTFLSDLKRRVMGQEPSSQQTETGLLGKPLASLKRDIDAFNDSQTNKALLDDIRLFNHRMLEQFDDNFPLKGRMLLDIGASPHGYAIESALEKGVLFYVGIGLDIAKHEYVIGEANNAGILLNMDASVLKFPDAFFDAIMSASVFEHIIDVPAVLAEIHRVLKPGGCALISFEPIWSCSYGYHLHHLAGCAGVIPPWAHLIWPKDQMEAFLSDKWPLNAPISVERAIEWIYSGDSINRLNVREFRDLFASCPLETVWMVELKEENTNVDPAMIQRCSTATGLDPDELTTKGLSLLLTKK